MTEIGSIGHPFSVRCRSVLVRGIIRQIGHVLILGEWHVLSMRQKPEMLLVASQDHTRWRFTRHVDLASFDASKSSIDTAVDNRYWNWTLIVFESGHCLQSPIVFECPNARELSMTEPYTRDENQHSNSVKQVFNHLLSHFITKIYPGNCRWFKWRYKHLKNPFGSS